MSVDVERVDQAATPKVKGVDPVEVIVRDDQDPTGKELWFTAAEWQDFTSAVAMGTFNLDDEWPPGERVVAG